MAKLNVGVGSTGRSEYIYIIDSLSSTGLGKTNIVYNTSGLNGHYVRNAGSATTINFVSQTATGTWTSGGWAEVDALRMPGLYRVDLPNEIFQSGSDKAIVFIRGVANTIPVNLEYQITALDPNIFTEAAIASSVWQINNRTITGGIADTVTTLTTRSGFAITSNLDKDGYTITAGIVTSVPTAETSYVGIATSVWQYTNRIITGGIADTVTTLTTRSGFAITSNFDKNGYTVNAGIVTSIANTVLISPISMTGIANSVWTNTSRTLSSLGFSAYNVWDYSDRTLTSSSGATAFDIWNYANRTITGGTGVSISQRFPQFFELLLIDRTGKIFISKADIKRILG